MTTEPQSSEDLGFLYHCAVAEFGARALRNRRALEAPTPADAVVVVRAGNRGQPRSAEAGGTDVAGASPLIRDTPRISGDIDVFHDRAERAAATGLADTQTLAAAGYNVAWLRQLPLM